MSLLLAAAPARAAITYVGRVASTTVTTTSTSTVLTAGRTVTAGDAIVVAVLLSSTSTTAAKVVDSAGNTYAVDRDQNDSGAGDRVVVFSATNAKALPSGGTITITYPSSAECNASVDEFTGVAALERAASTFATSTSFNSGASGTTSQASELIIGVVGNESGNAPVFAAGWTALPTLSIVDDRLTVAYQIASSTGSFTASGTISGTWMAAVLAYPASGSPPPVDQPPVAALAVSQAASPPLTVNASAAGSTDTDSTPIASYSFNWGDGSSATVVNAPTQTASHTYAAAGPYTVTLTATDTGNLTSTPVTKSITVSPADQPPVASLAVTQAASPPLTVNASAAGSTDTDSTPIASYSFSWGDGSTATVVNAPTQTASHTYAAAGPYTVTLTATDTGNLTSTPVTQSITVAAAPPPDQPPVASLAVSQAASPPLTVNASAAGSTDTDSTPIASYSFNWGDGSSATVVNAPTQTASHTYAAAGPYTVTLTATDTGNLTSTPVTKSITVSPADQPPVASLAVSQAASPPLTVNASAAGSTDTDSTPIASYSFNWGDGSSATVVNAPTQTASHTYAAAGPYTVTLTATDTGNLTSTPVSKSITVNPPASGNTVEARVVASLDDAEQLADLSVYVNSSDLELIHDASDQIVGIRWIGLAIPKGATITTAWIQFSAKEAQSEVTNLNLYGQAADNAPTFSTNNNDVSNRARTTAVVNWQPVAWNAGEVGPNQRTPDLKAVVQEVVNRAGWASGNALAVIINGTGHRTAWAWDGNAPQAALLHVEYSSGGPVDQAPVANLAVSQAASPPLTVSASAAGSTDTDSTPIASYSFSWGDGSNATVVNAPTQTATHTYSSAGTYTVTLTATDTGNNTSSPVTKSITVSADAPPVAALAVTQAASPPLTVNASAAGSTDTDSTPIASYSFSWGDGSNATVVNAPTQTATHTYSSAGTYTVMLTATDTGNNTSAPVTKSITVSAPAGGNTAEKRIAASSDDATEASRRVTLNGASLPLSSSQTVGMRWTGLTIPQGATITTAWIQFSSTVAASGSTSLTLRAQAADNATTFTTSNRNISSRALTSASTAWSPGAWSANETAAGERTPDLKAVVQEVVNRSAWASGNALAVIVTGTGSRTAVSFDGNAAQAALLHVEYTAAAPPPDQPPVASLAVSQAASPPLTVSASAAGSTDTDSTPIASYSFSWGDGSSATVVNAPTQTATHTYSSAGTYTVTLTAKDTGGLTSTPVTKSITVSADAPPVAKLAVTGSGLTANASAAGSTDTDSTPIASYSFSWGDGSNATVVNAPTQTASHTYASGGTYTVTLTVKDTGSNVSAPVTQSVTVSSGGSTSPTAVYVGYYDTHHAVNPQPKPNPWQGSPNTVFIGVSDHNDNQWDSSCLRVDNLSSSTLSGVVVTADLGSSHFALWGTNSIPAGYHLILAQTAYQNFDGSDTNPAGCYGCDPNLCLTERSSDIPVVHVTVNSTTKDYFDKGQVLNTGGYDGAGCPYVGGSLPTTRYDESHAWAQVFTASGAAIVANPSAVTSSPPPNHPRVLSMAAPWPNPARGVLALRFSLPAQGPAWLGLYDVSGRLVRTFVNNVMDAGDYDLRQDVSDVHPGVYFVRLVTPAATLHDRLVVAP